MNTQSNRPLRIGFFLEHDVSCGGVGPYGERVYQSLSTGNFSTDVAVTKVTATALAPEIATPSESSRPPVKNRMIGAARRIQRAWTMLCGADPASLIAVPASAVSTAPPKIELEIDLLHVPYQSPPTYGLSIPTIVTMHDVQELHFPKYFSPDERAYRATEYLRSLRNAAAVVVSFEHVRQDLIRLFECDPNKVFVLPLPYTECSLPAPDDQTSTELKEKYAQRPNFFLYPAQTWEHKNHLRLIEAFERVCLRSGKKHHLICTGKTNEFYSAAIADRVQTSPYSQQILFTDIVPAEELRWLYENCVGTVIPTLYEAGSFPLIESMTLGVPVVCANTTSLPDTIGNQSYVFDPRNVDEIARLMLSIATDQNFRIANLQNSAARIQSLQDINICSAYENLWRSITSVVTTASTDSASVDS